MRFVSMRLKPAAGLAALALLSGATPAGATGGHWHVPAKFIRAVEGRWQLWPGEQVTIRRRGADGLETRSQFDPQPVRRAEAVRQWQDAFYWPDLEGLEVACGRPSQHGQECFLRMVDGKMEVQLWAYNDRREKHLARTAFAEAVTATGPTTFPADTDEPALSYRIASKKLSPNDKREAPVLTLLRGQDVVAEAVVKDDYTELCDEHENPGPRRVCGYDQETSTFVAPIHLGSKTWLLLKTVETAHRQRPDGTPVRKDRVQTRFSLWGYACGSIRQVLDPSDALGKSGRTLSFAAEGTGDQTWRSVSVAHAQKKTGKPEPVAHFDWSNDGCEYSEKR